MVSPPPPPPPVQSGQGGTWGVGGGFGLFRFPCGMKVGIRCLKGLKGWCFLWSSSGRKGSWTGERQGDHVEGAVGKGWGALLSAPIQPISSGVCTCAPCPKCLHSTEAVQSVQLPSPRAALQLQGEVGGGVGGRMSQDPGSHSHQNLPVEGQGIRTELLLLCIRISSLSPPPPSLSSVLISKVTQLLRLEGDL